MANGFIRVPPDSTGKLIDTSELVNSSGDTVERHRINIADPITASALATVTSSGGMAVTITNPSTAVTVSNPSTAATNPWSSAPSFNLPIVSASSGLIQISGFVVSIKSTTATVAAQTTVTTSGDLLLAASANRHRAMVQNSGIIPVRLALSTAMPTVTAYHISLSAGTAADNGTGGAYIDEMWRGGISAITSAAGGTVVVTELTT